MGIYRDHQHFMPEHLKYLLLLVSRRSCMHGFVELFAFALLLTLLMTYAYT